MAFSYKLNECIQRDYNLNLIEVRAKVLKGLSVYVNRQFWERVLYCLNGYPTNQTDYLIGNIAAIVCKENKDVILLIRADKI